MDTLKCIYSRRSIRKYKPDMKVSDQALENILKAGCSAPSAHNGRPWEFIVIRDRQTIEALRKVKIYFEKPLKDAPLTIAIVFDVNVTPKIVLEYKLQDCAAAMQNMLIAATAQGLGTCWMGGLLDEEKTKQAKEILGVPDKLNFFGLLSVGYADEVKEPRGVIEQDKVHFEKY